MVSLVVLEPADPTNPMLEHAPKKGARANKDAMASIFRWTGFMV
jgi:hypothetical protein